MATNSSSIIELLRQINDRVIIVQFLVVVFFFVNMMLVVTFFQSTSFHTSARYILFAFMLLSDSFMLIMSNFLLVLYYYKLTIPVPSCIVLCIVVFLYGVVEQITLAAMTLERYVAICMPLRHAELCSTRSTVHCILIIHGISSVHGIVILSVFFASAPSSFYKGNKVCSADMFLLQTWHRDLRTAISQLYFYIIFIIVAFSYFKIMKVAKAASGQNKKSSQKGLKTVTLHAFQLLLCLIELWSPFIEVVMLKMNLLSYVQLKYFNYIMFYVAPRCLSPLIYGLRDEAFFLAMKNTFSFGLIKRSIT
ncbi:odorant receptor 131-2-like [Oryzias melastigma]|uniref:odorant receptor 131-2-like n=1 Tax=Oryzias melastigma TaxID=30732 RepID=UPI000CF802D5|nr:odorant receptor 131-2-like [Oryzias melastigma]